MQLIPSTIVVASLCAASIARADGTSKSYSDWTIDGSDAVLRVSFAPHDFATWMPSMDTDHDRKIDTVELRPFTAEVGRMVVDNTRLSSAETKDGQRSPCAPSSPKVLPVGEPLQEVQVETRFHCAGRIAWILIEAHYLPGLEPPHVGVATFSSRDLTAQHVFTKVSPAFELELHPAPLSRELGEQLWRGARSNTTIELILFLPLLLALFAPRRALLALFVMASVFELTMIVLGSKAHAVVGPAEAIAALSVAWAGAEHWIEARWAEGRRLAGCAICSAAFALAAASHRSASAPVALKASFALGALFPIAASALLAIAVRRASPRVQRAIGSGAILASIALFGARIL
jgi:hypothetical protein